MGLYEELCIKNDWIEIEETNRLPKFQPGLYINGKFLSIATYRKHVKLKFYMRN